jgi:hypothetical protein
MPAADHIALGSESPSVKMKIVHPKIQKQLNKVAIRREKYFIDIIFGKDKNSK